MGWLRPLRGIMTQKFTQTFMLADGFQYPDMSAWHDLALKSLKGASLDRLTGKTYDDIAVKPLYTARDVDGHNDTPAARARDIFLPWDIRQTVLNPDPTRANEIALGDLERGVSSIEFQIDPSGKAGVVACHAADFVALTRGILTGLATIALTAPHNPLEAAQSLANAIAPNDRASAKIAFNLDPMAHVMVGGGALSLSQAAVFARDTLVNFPLATALRADARPVHEGGGSEAQELAVLIASGIAHLKAGAEVGLTPDQVNRTLLFTLSIGPDVVMEIAKIKAARRLWAQVLAACSITGNMNLQTVTSARMMSIADPWTNILRATCAAFAAGAGGADIVTVLPFSHAFALADDQARRIARNTQLVLQEESHLGRVADPAAGAWAMEAVSEDLARVAWGLMQEIERAGGLEAALSMGLVQSWVAKTCGARTRDVARRKSALVGVSVFPNLAETLGEMPLTAPIHPAGAIAPMRLSAPFEALRSKPNGTIFLATLGPIATFNARAGFARNAFEAGGIKALGRDDVHASDADLVAAFTKSGAKIACLCGDDATYGTRGADVVKALREAGCKTIWLAGKGEIAGIDRQIFGGVDILAELTFAHQVLEHTT